MKNNASLLYSFFLIIGDFLALVAAFVSAYILRISFRFGSDGRGAATIIGSSEYLKIFLILLPFWLIIFGLLGLYNKKVYDNRFSELGRLVIGSFIGILFLISYSYMTGKDIFPAKLVTVYGLLLAFFFTLLVRTIARGVRKSLFSYGYGINYVLIVGETKITNELAYLLGDTSVTGYKIVGIVSRKSSSAKHGYAVYGSFEEAVKELKNERLNSIVQTELYASIEDNTKILSYAQENHIAYRFVPGNGELFVGNIEVDLFKSIPVIAVHQTALIGWGRIVKRIFDLLVGLVVFIVALPLMMLIYLWLSIFDHGDALYSQVRLGRFGNKFKIYKFRTYKHAYHRMTPEQGFEKMGKPELAKKYRENGDFLENDPRISRIGRFLRKYSLDELPQLLNLIKGEVSLVGPRALEPFELEKYDKKNLILSVKTGLTGLAVISGRRDIPFEERRKLDLYYVQNWSFWGDIVILVKTAWVILFHRGAY